MHPLAYNHSPTRSRVVRELPLDSSRVPPLKSRSLGNALRPELGLGLGSACSLHRGGMRPGRNLGCTLDLASIRLDHWEMRSGRNLCWGLGVYEHSLIRWEMRSGRNYCGGLGRGEHRLDRWEMRSGRNSQGTPTWVPRTLNRWENFLAVTPGWREARQTRTICSASRNQRKGALLLGRIAFHVTLGRPKCRGWATLQAR